jgi:carbonic anhydrase
MSVVDEIIQANREYASTFSRGDLPMPPKRHLAIVTCMDARILPSRILGLDVGDAHVIRNAGGRAKDALRSLVISQRLLGTTEVAVIHHTDCGMLTFSNHDLRDKVADELGPSAAHEASGIDFLPFSDVDDSVRDDVLLLRRSPLIPASVAIRGFVYDVRSGQLREIDAAGADTVAARPGAAASVSPGRDVAGESGVRSQ